MKNPINDRDDFKKRLEQINNWKNYYTVEQSVDALLFDMPELKGKIRAYQAKCTAYNQQMLTRWDNAPSEQEREEIVGEVVQVKED